MFWRRYERLRRRKFSKSKFPSEESMKKTYSKSTTQKEDINQIYNDIINSNSDNYKKIISMICIYII